MLLQRIQKYGFCLRVEKCAFFVPKYLGCIFDKNGRRLDAEKPRAISEVLHYVHTWVSSAKTTFLPILHNIQAPLNALPRKDAAWEKAFTKLNDLLISDMLLSNYNPNRANYIDCRCFKLWR